MFQFSVSPAKQPQLPIRRRALAIGQLSANPGADSPIQMQESNTVIVVTGHFRVSPEKIEALRPHARKVLEATRKERGCLLYAYGEDVLDPGLIRIVERWEDWDSLAAHGASDHIGAWREALAGIGVIEREVTAHEGGEERTL